MNKPGAFRRDKQGRVKPDMKDPAMKARTTATKKQTPVTPDKGGEDAVLQ